MLSILSSSTSTRPLILFTQLLRLGRIWHKVFFLKRSLTGLNSEFSFSLTSCLNKAEEHSLSYYLPIAGRRSIGFIPFPRVLVLCEMQPVSSRIWTRVAVSISLDDNHYTTGTTRHLIETTVLSVRSYRCRWMEAQRSNSLWPSQTPSCAQGVCFSSI